MKIADNITMLEVAGMNGGFIYPTLICDDIHLILADAGFPGQTDLIKQAITDGQMVGPNPQHTYDMELGIKSLEKVKGYDMCGMISYHCGFLKI